jgi:hypothetical protein
MRRWLLGVLGVGVLVWLGACSQQAGPGTLSPQEAVFPNITISKQMTVTPGGPGTPTIAKTASPTSVDVTSGTAELHYTLTVGSSGGADEGYTATLDSLTLTETAGGEGSFTVVDMLYCDAGSGQPDLGGLLQHKVFSLKNVAVAANGSIDLVTQDGPFDAIDVTDCGGDVVDVVTVTDEAGYAGPFEQSFAFSSASSGGATAATLVDEEEIPAGYSVSIVSLTLDGADVPFQFMPENNTLTVEDPAQGDYVLVKQLTRDAGLVCAPAQVANTASLLDAAGAIIGSPATATVDLTCTPPVVTCTYTLGYWKNHLPWPSPFDPEADFYSSTLSWLAILNEPVKGRAYVQLAHQYVAAMLNVGGVVASAPSAVSTALLWAEDYFSDHDIDSAESRDQARTFAGILDDFNSGFLGVPHCGD